MRALKLSVSRSYGGARVPPARHHQGPDAALKERKGRKRRESVVQILSTVMSDKHLVLISGES